MRTRLAEVSVTPEPFTDPAVQEQIEQLAMRIEQLVGDREQEASLAAKLDDLERRVPTEIVTPEELSSALERTRAELAAPPIAADTDPRVEQLLEDLSALRHELADVREVPAAEPHDDAPLVAKIEALEQRLDAPRTADPRVEELSHDIATLRDRVAQAERPPATDPVVASELDTMSQRLRFMDERMNDDMATTDGVARALDALRAELAMPARPAIRPRSPSSRTRSGRSSRASTAWPRPLRPGRRGRRAPPSRISNDRRRARRVAGGGAGRSPRPRTRGSARDRRRRTSVDRRRHGRRLGPRRSPGAQPDDDRATRSPPRRARPRAGRAHAYPQPPAEGSTSSRRASRS